MDRPARNKKSVDYSQFLDLDDDDRDFASSPPVSKKARLETKKEKKEKPIKKIYKEEVESTPKNSPKNRLPLDDKLYQRDLEVALALSMKETSVIIENDENIPRNEAPQDTYTCIKDNDVSEVSFTNCSVDSSTLGLEEITDGNEDSSNGRGRRQAASKAITEQRKLLKEESGDEEEEEDEFRPDTVEDEDSESDASLSDEDEEFVVKKSKKPSITKVVQEKPKSGKKEKNVPKAQKLEPAIPVTIKIKPMPPKKAPVSSPASSKPPASHSSPPAGMKRAAWTPPASSGAGRSPLTGVTIRSPNQGLRLGLSRLARVKPLHPTTALH